MEMIVRFTPPQSDDELVKVTVGGLKTHNDRVSARRYLSADWGHGVFE
jgi:hypothetical protein